MGTAGRLDVLRFLEGGAQQCPASWADEGVMGVRVQHEDEVGKVVDQAAREFLLLMEPMLQLAPFGDIHDRALVPDDLSASVAHGGGAVHAHDRASIFAEKRDFAALDHRLRLHLLLQDLAFGGIDKNLGDLPFEQVLFGFVAEHADQCGVGVEDAALGRGDVDAFPESFEELGEAGFIPPQSGNVARENGDAADGIAAQHGVSDTIEIKRRRLILQAYLNDTGPMTAFLETGHGAPGEIFFLFRAGLNKFGERTADNLLERRLDEIAEHAVDGANPPVDANRHQDVIEGVDQIAVALLRTGDDVKQLDQLFDIVSRSQQGYRDLIDSFDDILMAVSIDGRIRAVNSMFCDLVETPFQEIIGRPLAEFVQPGTEQEENLARRAMAGFEERRHWTGVVQVRLKNQSSPFYFDCVAHAMLRGDTVSGITILARDVSALRRNETRFTELFETLREGIYITTPEGRILDANPALVRMLGYESKEDLLKRQVSEILVDPAERKVLQQQVETQPMVQGREITLLRKDGSSIVCMNSATAVSDAGGRVVRYQGAVMDITERREMEHRLHQQQEFARRLVDNFPDLILVPDADSHYTFISPRCRELLGYSLEEAQYMEFGGRTHPEDLPAALSIYKDILAGKQTFASMELRVRHKQGDWRRILFNFSPLSDESGNIEGVVLSGRDVTDIKRLEEQLIPAEKLHP